MAGVLPPMISDLSTNNNGGLDPLASEKRESDPLTPTLVFPRPLELPRGGLDDKDRVLQQCVF